MGQIWPHPGLRLLRGRHVRQPVSGGAWLRPSDDGAAEFKVSGPVPEAPAGAKGAKTGAVEVRRTVAKAPS